MKKGVKYFVLWKRFLDQVISIVGKSTTFVYIRSSRKINAYSRIIPPEKCKSELAYQRCLQRVIAQPQDSTGRKIHGSSRQTHLVRARDQINETNCQRYLPGCNLYSPSSQSQEFTILRQIKSSSPPWTLLSIRWSPGASSNLGCSWKWSSFNLLFSLSCQVTRTSAPHNTNGLSKPGSSILTNKSFQPP